MTINTFEHLIHSPKPLGKMGHLILAGSMILPDKAIKSMAGEYWADKVSKSQINNDLLGENLGKYFKISFAPLKRFTDLLTETMTRISPLHDLALKGLLENMMREMAEEPINGLKKLLEIYAEIIRKTGDTPPQFLDYKLKKWSKNSSLKKIISSFT